MVFVLRTFLLRAKWLSSILGCSCFQFREDQEDFANISSSATSKLNTVFAQQHGNVTCYLLLFHYTFRTCYDLLESLAI